MFYFVVLCITQVLSQTDLGVCHHDLMSDIPILIVVGGVRVRAIKEGHSQVVIQEKKPS